MRRYRELYSVLYGDLNGKQIQKKSDLLYIQWIHFAVQQKPTQHCKAAHRHERSGLGEAGEGGEGPRRNGRWGE